MRKMTTLLLTFLLPMMLGFSHAPTESKHPSTVPVQMQVKHNQQESIPVLMYHCISKGNNYLYVPPEQFEHQLVSLQKDGYTTITASELLSFWERGTVLPKKPVLITLDDGYEDNYTNAFPILKKHRAKATIFVVTGAVGRPNYMSWQQLGEMNKSGLVDLESHTVHHHNTRKITDAEFRTELVDSKQELESHLNKKIVIFAFPFGESKPSSAAILQESGYRIAFSTNKGLAHYPDGKYRLKRLEMFAQDSPPAAIAEASQPKKKPFLDPFSILASIKL
ncbi:polysaccharide deacetylase family protein [Brevibacillus fluminis]|uniref:Polysaccharide deacetylase family protein n=1 Tax=Brevibacillus fluminis TaxID=511487 RepID=A0A3M8DIK9_9BACL|nr:polysaccharide deacetylase family protein [Brevibacillus fluminis]RNB87205.1 polysaccharide deacetylase family protein [Brevibacillus fluminis]